MAVAAHQNGRRSVGALLRDLAEESVGLLRNEVVLARVETMQAAEGIGHGSMLVAGAAVLALLGGLALIAGLILLIGDQWLPRDLYWLAALGVAVVTGVVAAWFARQGMTLLSPTRFAPNSMVTTPRETKDDLAAAVRHG
ncbi:MAG TPA: phage holin family protein [Gemmatimonadaceae bacterium]|jgi:uncharacterized membrane protein YqjE